MPAVSKHTPAKKQSGTVPGEVLAVAERRALAHACLQDARQTTLAVVEDAKGCEQPLGKAFVLFLVRSDRTSQAQAEAERDMGSNPRTTRMTRAFSKQG